MTLHLSDLLVDAIKIKIAPRNSRYCVIVSFDDDAPEEINAIQHFLQSVSLFHVDLCARAAQQQIGGPGNDTATMTYLRSDDGTPQGVEFAAYFGGHEPLSAVIISTEAADRLLTRFFDLMRQIAETENNKILQHPRWQDFLVGAAAVKQRTLSQSANNVGN